MASSIKIPPTKRFNDSVMDHDNNNSFQISHHNGNDSRDPHDRHQPKRKKAKFNEVRTNLSSNHHDHNDINDTNNNDDDNNDNDKDISYTTPPPSSVASDSRDRSVSPNDESSLLNINHTTIGTVSIAGPQSQKLDNNNIGPTDTVKPQQQQQKHAAAAAPAASEDVKVDKLLQNDPTYISLCAASSLLRSQRDMALKDIVKLNNLKLKALENPQAFIEQLGTKNGEIVDAIPKQIRIINGDLNRLFKK